MLFSSSAVNYGTIDETVTKETNEKNVNVKRTVWKVLFVGLFLFALCAGVYYYYTNDPASSSINSNNNKIDSYASTQNSSEWYDEIEASTEDTNEFYGYYSESLNDYLYTVYTDEVDTAGSDYMLDVSAGYLWSGELPGITEPLFRYDNEDCDGEDHFYVTEQEDYGPNSNWQQIAGFIMTQECSDYNTALYEYYSATTCNHYYTIDQNDVPFDGDFVFQRVVGYVAIE